MAPPKELVDALVKVAKVTLQQSGRRTDGAYVMRPLCRLATHDVGVAQRLEDEHLWQILFSADSYLHATGFVAKLSEPDLANFIALVVQGTLSYGLAARISK